jgi:hypothetical protein
MAGFLATRFIASFRLPARMGSGKQERGSPLTVAGAAAFRTISAVAFPFNPGLAAGAP